MANPPDDVAAADASAPLVTYFQPFYNLRTGRLQGVEALARRRSADGTHTVLPAQFFDLARASDQMREIDLWILDDALSRTARVRMRESLSHLVLSINLSWELLSSPDMSRAVLQALARHDVPGDRLLVDIASDMCRQVVADASVVAQLRLLQEREVTFCVDGFTADDLDLLPAAVAAPADIVKLHPRQFVADADGGYSGMARVVEAVHDRDLPVLAAGIENEAQLAVADELQVEWAQGFLLGEPSELDAAIANPEVPNLR